MLKTQPPLKLLGYRGDPEHYARNTPFWWNMSSENTPRKAAPHARLPSLNTGQNVRKLRRDTQQASAIGTGSFIGQRTSASDPFGNETAFRTSSTGIVDQIAIGIVVDGSAISNCYRVSVDHSTPPLMATAAMPASHGCVGATQINSYQPGSRVIIFVGSRTSDAIILGSIPSFIETQKRAMHDYISPMSRARVDDVHKKYLKTKNSSNQSNFNFGRPLDATHGGEWGAVTTTGAAVTLDDFMLRASINEFCGMYAFYHDMMLRLAGFNLQIWTSGHEREAINDQGEYNDYQGYTPYPWENLGEYGPSGNHLQQYEPENYLSFKGQPYYSRWENKHEFAQPFHRTMDFFGYLGQGHRRVVRGPAGGQRFTYDTSAGAEGPTPFDSEAVDDDGSFGSKGPTKETSNQVTKPAITFSEQNTGLDGRMFFSSARGITFVKRILLPSSNRRLRPENYEKGDDAFKNYKPSSMNGSGEDHKITGGPETTDNLYPNLQRATAIMDLHGYLFNYAGVHPFYWHKEDYKTWELDEYDHAEVQQKVPKFEKLSGTMFLKEEDPKYVFVDHRDRFPAQKFYETESFISMLDDGGIVIGDGYGAEIRMSAGCVFISAPGDVWCKGGRDVQMWGGNDVIMKANKSADISANENSVRIKAEKHLMLMGGNEDAQTGGVLIESRTAGRDYEFQTPGDETKFNGLVLRAPKASVVTEAKHIYLRTGSEDGSIQKGGHIYIDAQTGDADIITRSKNIYNYCDQGGAIYNFFGDPEDVDKSNYFTKDYTALAGRLIVEKDGFFNGGVLTNGNILVGKGHIATEGAQRASLFVGPLDNDAVNQIKEALDEMSEIITDTIPDAAMDIYFSIIETQWYDDLRAGNDEVLELTCFSFRTDEDYNITDFRLYEDRWQQMARIAGKDPDKWEEKKVKVPPSPSETYSFPGKKWLKEEPAYVEQDLKIALYQGDGFRDKNRNKESLDGVYREPEYKPQEAPKIIDNNYPIIPRK